MKKKYIEEPAVTVIGKGMQVKAELLSGKGTVRIDGEYNGDINIDGELIVAESAHINGNISANISNISGSIKGDVVCSDLLHIRTTGQIKGDISCNAVLTGSFERVYTKIIAKAIQFERLREYAS